MKKLSIRLKITVWFTATLIIVVLFAFVAVFAGSHRSLRKNIQDRLIEIVNNNADEIDYYCDTGEHSGLIYGENPLAGTASDLNFVDSKIQQIWAAGTWYYIFDRQLTFDGSDELWIRGVMSEEQGDRQLSGMIQIALIVMPLLVVLASVGGYLIARRALNPIQKISWTARQIGEGNDLKRRIDLGEGDDELHQLAATFNEMFDHLEQSFEQERQFTSDVSHELRTPMAVITAQCEYTL